MAEDKTLDGISKLPDPLRHHILSFLPTKEVSKTSLLSKSWLNTWHTRPTLELSYDQFFSKKFRQTNEIDGDGDDSEVFRSYIERALQRYHDQNTIVGTFKISFGSLFHDGKSLLVEKITKLAIQYGARNLDFDIESCVVLPQIVLEAEYLIRLNIVECKLIHQEMEEIRCHRLKQLSLFDVSLDDEMLQKVISGCPLIEFLKISQCCELQNIKVAEVGNLKQIVVELFRNQKIEVDAQTLEFLDCSHPNEHCCSATSCLTLCTPQYQNMKNLVLHCVGIYDNFFINFGSKFPHLEDLCISRCPHLRKIQISSGSLKKIHLKENRELEAQFDVPSIVQFETRNVGSIPECSFTAVSDHWVSDIGIHMRSGHVDTSWFLRLMKLLANLSQSQISLSIKCPVAFEIDEAFGIDEIRNSMVVAPPIEVQMLSIYCGGSKFAADKFVDGIFSICHPKTMVANLVTDFPKHGWENQFSKSLYEILMIETMEHRFNNLQQTKFWQHVLTGVTVEIIHDGACVMRIRNYLSIENWSWKKLLKMLKKNHNSITKMKIHFKLDWETL